MNDETLLRPLFDALQINSVSTQTGYLPEMAKMRDFLTDLFRSLGFETKILKGITHDCVFAQRIENKKLPTVLIYGHYDVQPPEPLEEWKTSPFTPTLIEDRLYARGATDNKGQFMIHIMAVKKMLEKSDNLPLNIKFIIEGEEEIGSISVADLAKQYATTLFKCDYLLVSDTEMPSPNQPSIDIGLRGLLYTEVRLRTAQHDLHSGQYGGIAANPIIILAELISALKDPAGKIRIPHFYDKVKPLTIEEKQDYQKADISKNRLMQEGNFFLVSGGEEKYSLNERRWSQPTLDVNGIWGGYQEEGSKTIIPAQAGAKISMRLVPDQDPEKIFRYFKSFINRSVPKAIQVEIIKIADSLPYKAPIDDPVFSLMKKSLQKVFGTEPLFTGVGGSIGFVPVIVKALHVPCLLVGFGLPDDGIHAPNEHFNLNNYYRGIECLTDFYQKLQKINRSV